MKARRASREERGRQVRDWLASGESAEQFARRLRIQPSTLTWWRWKLQSDGESLSRTQATPQFLEITAPMDGPGEARIELRVDDVCVFVPAGFDAKTLDQVLGTLRSSE